MVVEGLSIFAAMFNPQFAIDYLKHRFTAKTRHGVHSPFVYKLIDEIIYDFRAKPDYAIVEFQRSQLLNDGRIIHVTDLGAGSQINKQNQKSVKAVAANALKPPRLAQLIYRLARNFSPGSIIELGTCLGITIAYLAKAAPLARVISLEGCPETAAIASETLKRLEIGNVELLTGNFDSILPGILNKQERLDFVFVDGNHRKAATLNYFEWCLPKLSESGLMIFDDIYWSRGMKQAWLEIKNDPRVTITVDLFWIGLVFVRPGKVKENFKVRF